jgi:hypothetical protein
MPLSDYTIQSVNSVGPLSAGFSIEGGRVTDSYYIVPQSLASPSVLSVEVLSDAVKETLGTTEAAGDGSLTRALPKCHPLFPWCYASSITRLVGTGKKDMNGNEATLYDADVFLEADPMTSQSWAHVWYQMDVEFTPRPYALLDDESITVESLTWTEVDGTTVTSDFANEWIRYTEFDYEPNPEIAHAQQGQMKFTLNTTDPPHGYTFSGFPRMIIPKATVRLRWYQVPFSYLLSVNSYLVEFIGRINQFDWNGWDAGSLLYLGVRVLRKYTPPVPAIEFSELGNNTFSTEKYCDIELMFEETVREQTDVPTPTNDNYIAAGHNLQPFLGNRDFYYATSGYDNETPTYFSAPFELLFTDPDYA